MITKSHFHLSLIFTGKAEAYPRGALCWTTLLGNTPSLARKYQTREKVTKPLAYYGTQLFVAIKYF